MNKFHVVKAFVDMLQRNNFEHAPPPFTLERGSCPNSLCTIKLDGTAVATVRRDHGSPFTAMLEQNEYAENTVLLAMKSATTNVTPEKGPPPLRVALLEDAIKLTAGPRNADYGKPLDNMRNTAEIFKGMTGIDMTPEQAALFLVAVKLARLRQTPNHEDSFTDAAAYVAIAFECVLEG